jgi:hypothetical protein
MARAVKWSVNTYEKKNGLPLTDFRHPVDQFLDERPAETISEDELDKLLGE